MCFIYIHVSLINKYKKRKGQNDGEKVSFEKEEYRQISLRVKKLNPLLHRIIYKGRLTWISILK